MPMKEKHRENEESKEIIIGSAPQINLFRLFPSVGLPKAEILHNYEGRSFA
jgi:hypothetical protein